MILALSLLCLVSAVVFGGLQIYWAWRFARLYIRSKAAAGLDAHLPRAAVLLAVRGADPSLVDCLQGLLALDYPSFEIHAIVDSAEDPAWNVVHDIVALPAVVPVRVHVLERRRDTCTLKVSALLQAIEELEPSIQVVALIDADVRPHRNWLRDLVTPFADPKVGAVSGVRWFAPRDSLWGSLVRANWNVAAGTQMLAFQIPWAGSMGFRADVIRHPLLREQWGHSFCDDVSSYPVLRRLGLQFRFAPAATMFNHESIGLRNCFTYIRRQLLCTRMHHPFWSWILATSFGAGLSMILTIAMTVVTLVVGDWPAAACCGGALAVYFLGLAPCLVWIDHRVQRLGRERGEAPSPVTWKTLAALPLTQAVYLAALASASLMRQIDWRGVTYRLDGPGKVRLVQYRPYRAEHQCNEEHMSIV